MLKECRHIKPNGLKCGSPALGGSPFCYFHARMSPPAPRRKPQADEPLQLPLLESPDDIHSALIEIFDALASSRISPKRAGTLLYSLQLAEKTMMARSLSALAKPLLPALDDETLAPELRVCSEKDDCSRCEFVSTCTNPKTNAARAKAL